MNKLLVLLALVGGLVFGQIGNGGGGGGGSSTPTVGNPVTNGDIGALLGVDLTGDLSNSGLFYLPDGVPAPVSAPTAAKVGSGTGGSSYAWRYLWRTPTGFSPMSPTSVSLTSMPSTLDTSTYAHLAFAACPLWATGVYVTRTDASGSALVACGDTWDDKGQNEFPNDIIGNTNFSSDASTGLGTAYPIVSTSTGSAFGNLAFANNNTDCPFQDCVTGLLVVNHTNDASFGYTSFGVITYVDSDSFPYGQIGDIVLPAGQIVTQPLSNVLWTFRADEASEFSNAYVNSVDFDTRMGSVGGTLAGFSMTGGLGGTLNSFRYIEADPADMPCSGCSFTSDATGIYLGDWSQYPNGRAIRVLGGQTFLGPDEADLPAFIRGYTNGLNLITLSNSLQQGLGVEVANASGNASAVNAATYANGDTTSFEADAYTVAAGGHSTGILAIAGADTAITASEVMGINIADCENNNGAVISTCNGLHVNPQTSGTANYNIFSADGGSGTTMNRFEGHTFIGPDESDLPAFIQGWFGSAGLFVTDTVSDNALGIETTAPYGLDIIAISNSVDTTAAEATAYTSLATGSSFGVQGYAGADGAINASQVVALVGGQCDLADGATADVCGGLKLESQTAGTANYNILSEDDGSGTTMNRFEGRVFAGPDDDDLPPTLQGNCSTNCFTNPGATAIVSVNDGGAALYVTSLGYFGAFVSANAFDDGDPIEAIYTVNVSDGKAASHSYGVHIDQPVLLNGGTIDGNNIGIAIGSMTEGVDNYAIKTGLGESNLGDTLVLNRDVGDQFVQAKVTASDLAPGAGFCSTEWRAGTLSGTGKLVAYCGTSSTPTTIADNVGGSF